mmetsp:Transcript_87611/g.234565  ORF Transcript_87611/g.234565 Transcript_87611/m.234565 type:complete len:85 (-) Transcript_87611:169-423(-)
MTMTMMTTSMATATKTTSGLIRSLALLAVHLFLGRMLPDNSNASTVFSETTRTKGHLEFSERIGVTWVALEFSTSFSSTRQDAS